MAACRKMVGDKLHTYARDENATIATQGAATGMLATINDQISIHQDKTICTRTTVEYTI